MTEVAIRPDNAVALPGSNGLAPTPAALVSQTIALWDQDIESCLHLAARISRTELVPASYWPLPAGKKLWDMPDGNPRRRASTESPEDYQARFEVATATVGGTIYTGAQLGLQSWNVALQGIDYVRGRQSMRAEFMLSLYLSAGHEMQLNLPPAERPERQAHLDGERSDTRAAAWFRRRSGSVWELVEFTIQEAENAGFVKGKGPDTEKGKGNEKYLSQPKVMLWARMSSTAVKTKAPEVLRGMACVEEMQDEPAADIIAAASDLHEPAPARTSAAAILARAERAAPAPAPVGIAREVDPQQGATLAAPVPAEPEVQRYVLPVSKPQLDLIKGAFEKHGYGGRATAVREQRMRVLSDLLERPITDPREMTGDEARLVIDHLGPDSGLGVIHQILGITPAAVDETETGGDFGPTVEADWARDEVAAEQ